MTIASISLHPKLPPFLSASVLGRLHRFICSTPVLARQHQNLSNVRRLQHPPKNLLKAQETLKRQFSSLAPVLSARDKPQLSENQAIGTVVSLQANSIHVVVLLPMEATLIKYFGTYRVELLCMKKIKRTLFVGDDVFVGSIDWVTRTGMIENVFKRKSEILDPPLANVDNLLVLFSWEQPMLEPFMLTRFLVEAESTGIRLNLLLNKSELVDEATLVEWQSRLRGWGYEPFLCSVDAKRGLDTLQFILRKQISVIVGPSGVGKSSLINALRVRATEDYNWFEPILGSKWFEEQRVGKVSSRSRIEKYTTRNVSLLPLSGRGYLVDTPGFIEPSLMKVTTQSLAQHFPEIRKMHNRPGRCFFSNCLHIGEPGCLVKGDWERYPYYLQLLDEIKIREEFEDCRN